MVNQTLWIGIVVGVFFVGIGISYAIFSSSYNPNSMRFQNQPLFDQMMSQNPKMTAQWMTAMMQDPQQMQQMQQLMLDPEFRQQMFQQMNTMMDDPQLQQQMFQQMGIMMNDPQLRQQMIDMMTQNPEMIQAMMQNQQMIDIMTQNPEMIQAMMQNQQMIGIMGQGRTGPGTMMGESPIEQHETMLELIEEIMEEKQLRDHMFAHIIEDQELVHQMFTLMDSNPELKKHMEAHVSGNITGYENP